MPEINLKKVKRIVILNMIAKTIGDSLFITPIFRIIKKNLPKSYLAVTATSTNKDLFTNNPYLDEIIYVKDLGIIGEPKVSKIKKAFIYSKIIAELMIRLRKRKFDLCIIISPKFLPVYFIPKLAGIRYIVGHEYKGSRSFFLTKKCEFTDQLRYPNRHYLECYLDLLRLLDMKFSNKDKFVEKHLTKEEIEKGENILKKSGVKKSDIIIPFQSVAKWPNKTWPYRYFGKLAKLLIEYNKNIKIILLGSPPEFKQNEKIKKFFPERIINLSGKISLGDVAAVMKFSKLAVGNDSGLMHIAGAVGTPTIVIYGISNSKHSKVMGKGKHIAIFKNDFCKPCMFDNRNCKFNYKCMKVVKPEDVMKEVKKIV